MSDIKGLSELQIIENFILWFASSETEREEMSDALMQYLKVVE